MWFPPVAATIGSRIFAGKLQIQAERRFGQVADVSSRASIDDFRDAVLKQFGRVDILVNAAGYT